MYYTFIGLPVECASAAPFLTEDEYFEEVVSRPKRYKHNKMVIITFLYITFIIDLTTNDMVKLPFSRWSWGFNWWLFS